MTATIADVLAGRSRWCVEHADCERFLWPHDVSLASTRVIADIPYGAGSYKTDKHISNSTILSWFGARTTALFGWPEDLAWLCSRLGLPRPSEWITWWAPNKCDPRANDLREAECIAIFGDVPGRRRITRKRSKACIDAMERYPGKRRARVSNGPIDVAQDGSVWRINAPGVGFNASSRLHPNEKPLELMERLVLLCSEPDDIIIDPTCGSGTTGLAALRLDRRFIGIETAQHWADLSRDRISAEERGSTLAAARAGQAALFPRQLVGHALGPVLSTQTVMEKSARETAE